ncbi:hypothetical protein NDU88_007349 [Pleurodeles waltl]|uniref:Uncharacterized protein n=1 Tax=Pleurodeles waltl TaxID=8319 RepID=A0AAV7WHE6_PLEWA|nr:hypothetical protein NDU88_007349 [Pleurodeles waltl]
MQSALAEGPCVAPVVPGFCPGVFADLGTQTVLRGCSPSAEILTCRSRDDHASLHKPCGWGPLWGPGSCCGPSTYVVTEKWCGGAVRHQQTSLHANLGMTMHHFTSHVAGVPPGARVVLWPFHMCRDSEVVRRCCSPSADIPTCKSRDDHASLHKPCGWGPSWGQGRAVALPHVS